MANDKQFVNGLRFNTPRDRAPSWIKGHISVKVEDFIAYAQAHQDDRGWLNIDVKESKGGNLYCELNTYGRDKGLNQREGYGEEDPALSSKPPKGWLRPTPDIPIDEPLPEQKQKDDIPF